MIYWAVEPEKLDYNHYLPIFFDGELDVMPCLYRLTKPAEVASPTLKYFEGLLSADSKHTEVVTE